MISQIIWMMIKKDFLTIPLSLMTMATLSNGGVEKFDIYYKRAISLLDDMLVNFLQKEQNPQQVCRVLNLLGVTDQNHVHEDIERISIRLFSEYLQKYENNKKVSSHQLLERENRFCISGKGWLSCQHKLQGR